MWCACKLAKLKSVFDFRAKAKTMLWGKPYKLCKIRLISLGITSIKASDFERNLNLKIRGEQQTSRQRSVGCRRLLLTSDFPIEIFFKIESFYGSVTQKWLNRACRIFQASFIAWFRTFFWFKTMRCFVRGLFTYAPRPLNGSLLFISIFTQEVEVWGWDGKVIVKGWDSWGLFESFGGL